MNNITAAVARGPGQDFSVEQIQLDEPRADEVLVKIAGVGICHSDLAAKEQHLPFPLPAVLGHEGAGIVEKVGSEVSGLQPGDHVVLSFVSCGHCKTCENDMPSYCQQGFVPQNFAGVRADGSKTHHCGDEAISGNFFGQSSFGTYALTSASNTIKVRDDAPIEMLGPLGCGIQTGAGSIIKAMACPQAPIAPPQMPRPLIPRIGKKPSNLPLSATPGAMRCQITTGAVLSSKTKALISKNTSIVLRICHAPTRKASARR